MIATIQLLQALSPFQLLLDKVAERISENTSKAISLSYSVIELTLTTSEENSTLCFQCVFHIQQQKIKLHEVYVSNADKKKELQSLITRYADKLSFNTGTTGDDYSSILHYLTIADTIAKQSFQYSSGDDYYPGYYSEIIIDEKQLVLKQINRHNSRSIDHKKDYYLRELEFYIPLQPTELKLSYQEEAIGEMKIRFFDHSSLNNKEAGDCIHQQIEAEKLLFASK